MAKIAPKPTAARDSKSAENRHFAETGTPLAIRDLAMSCGLAPAKQVWGGARNWRHRWSDRLTLDQCNKLIGAARFAELIGLPFNRHWIVHSERAGIPDRQRTDFVGELLELVRRYVKRRKGHFAAIYVRENGFNKGEHIHILMHVPGDLDLRNMTTRWVKKAGGTYKAGVSRVRTIGGSLKRLDAFSEHYQVNADNVLAYLLKAADAETAAALGLHKFGQFGWIMGKRCGSTENIAETARARWLVEGA